MDRGAMRGDKSERVKRSGEKLHLDGWEFLVL